MSLEPLVDYNQYYVPLSSGSLLPSLFQPGQLFWAPALNLYGNKPIKLLKGKYNPDTLGTDYRIEDMTDREFDAVEEPIKTLGIRADERLAIVGCKNRPVVLVSQHPEKWKDGKRRNDDSYLVAPITTFDRPGKKEPYSLTFTERTKAFGYNTYFYLPQNAKPHFSEGFVRFDKIQAIHKDSLKQMPLMLSDDAFELLKSWLMSFIGADLTKVNAVLFLYQEEAMEALKKAGMV